MRKLLSGIVVLVFGLQGTVLVLRTFGVVANWRIPGESDRIFKGELGLLIGIGYLLVAVGIYRYQIWARGAAGGLASVNLIGSILPATSARIPITVLVSFLTIWLFVSIWLCWPSVRIKFAATRKEAKAT